MYTQQKLLRVNMVLKFGTKDSIVILGIIVDMNNEIPYMQIARKRKISCYYIKKIYKIFQDLKTEEDIRTKIKNIEVDNNVIILYTRNKQENHDNYIKHKESYKDRIKRNRLKIALAKAHKFINDNTEPVKVVELEIQPEKVE